MDLIKGVAFRIIRFATEKLFKQKVRGPENSDWATTEWKKVIQDLIKSLINIASYQILRNVEK